MEDSKKPAYWAVLPAKVRYDESLRPNAKLLYAEITALTGADGFCWASNKYFGELFGIMPDTVTRLISQLEQRGYISVDVVRNEKNAVVQRRIFSDRPTIVEHDPPGNISDTPSRKNILYPPGNISDKNNINNINNPPKAPRRGRRVKSIPEWKPERFEAFWKAYPRTENRTGAVAAWDQLQADDGLLDIMARGLQRALSSEDWKRGIGIPHASTWIRNRRWEDVPMQAAQYAPSSIVQETEVY